MSLLYEVLWNDYSHNRAILCEITVFYVVRIISEYKRDYRCESKTWNKTNRNKNTLRLFFFLQFI